MRAPTVHHVTISVTDAEVSAEWYQRLLGPAQITRREGPDWIRVRMQWPSGLVIGATQHEGTTDGDRFDHTRVGLDHLGLTCASEAEVRQWADLIDDLGIERGPVEDVPYGWAVTTRDPDGLPIEFFCLKE